MKAIYIIIVHAILPLQLYSYDGHGSGCGELKDIERISNPSPDVEGYKEKAEDFAKKIEKESLDTVNSITLDTSAVSDWVIENTKGRGWTAERLGREIAKVINKAEVELNEQKDIQSKELVKKALELYRAKIKTLSPKVKFQVDNEWEERCCEQGDWKRGGANVVGVYEINSGGSVKVSFKVGGTLGVALLTGAEISLSAKGFFGILQRPNPVDPTTSKGSSITIKATPSWKATYEVNAGLGIFVIVGVMDGASIGDTLKTVAYTFNCE